MRDARAGRYDLIVAYLPLYSPWHPRHGFRSLASDPLHPWRALTRVFGVSWLRLVQCPVPLVAVDFNDHFGIRRPGFFLLDKADVVFKRELPADRWQVLAGSAHPALPTRRIRSQSALAAAAGKAASHCAAARRASILRRSGRVSFRKRRRISSSAATPPPTHGCGEPGLATLQGARGSRYSRRHPGHARCRAQEFYRRMSRAWLAWSPSGFGWECYRTDEAAQCLTVPVVNHPTIERHRPLLQGAAPDPVRHRRRRTGACDRGRARRQGAAQADGAGGARARRGAPDAAARLPITSSRPGCRFASP